MQMFQLHDLIFSEPQRRCGRYTAADIQHSCFTDIDTAFGGVIFPMKLCLSSLNAHALPLKVYRNLNYAKECKKFKGKVLFLSR